MKTTVAQMLAAEARLADALGCLVRSPHEVFCVGYHCHLRVPASKLAYVPVQQLTTIPSYAPPDAISWYSIPRAA